VARIKLDENSYGISNSNLFKDFDVFSATSQIAAELDLMRSEAILKKVADKLGADHSLFRVGNLREIELGKNRPFGIQFLQKGEKWLDRNLGIEMEADGKYVLRATINHKEMKAAGHLGDTLSLSGLKMFLSPAQQLDPNKKLDIAGEYRLRMHSPRKQISQLRGGGLDITASDDDVPIIRIAFRHSSPDRAAEVANTIAETYIEDHIAYKTQAAGKSLVFIDSQIKEVEEALIASEAALETYRDNEQVINTRQETETNLRKIAEMKIQQANMEMREQALDSLDRYINSGNSNFQDLAPSFESFGDLLFTELLKKIKGFEAERIDLLVNFTENSRPVKAVDAKIAETVIYIKESIHNARKDMAVKSQSLKDAIAESEKEFEGLPARDRQMVILDRDFQLNQKLYLFLMEKRMESAIQESASMSFHRIIDPARTPEVPISPKPAFISVVAGFMGLLLGLGLILAKDFFSLRLRNEDEIAKRSTFPLLGTVPQLKGAGRQCEFAVGDLSSRMLAREDAPSMKYVAFASAEAGSGKTFLSKATAGVLANAGYKVAWVDLDFRKEEGEKGIAEAISKGKQPLAKQHNSAYDQYPAGDSSAHPSAILQQKVFKTWFGKLAKDYDFVLVDTSACDEAAETLNLLQDSDLCLWISRQGHSKREAISLPDQLTIAYGIGPFVHVLNATPEGKGIRRTIMAMGQKAASLLKFGKSDKALGSTGS